MTTKAKPLPTRCFQTGLTTCRAYSVAVTAVALMIAAAFPVSADDGSRQTLSEDAQKIVDNVKAAMPNVCRLNHGERRNAVARVGMALAFGRQLQGGAKDASNEANRYFAIYCGETNK